MFKVIADEKLCTISHTCDKCYTLVSNMGLHICEYEHTDACDKLHVRKDSINSSEK